MTEGCKCELCGESETLHHVLSNCKYALDNARGDHVHHKMPRSRARSPSRNHNSLGICWFHQTYQEKVQRCKQLCSFQKIPSSDKGNTVAATAAFGQNQVSRLFHVNHIKGDQNVVAISYPARRHIIRDSPEKLNLWMGSQLRSTRDSTR